MRTLGQTFTDVCKTLDKDERIFGISCGADANVVIALKVGTQAVAAEVTALLDEANISSGYRFVSQNGKPLQTNDQSNAGLDAMLNELPPESDVDTSQEAA